MKEIPPQVGYVIVIVVVIVALGFGLWFLTRAPHRAPAASNTNMAHGVPPPTSPPSQNWHGPAPTHGTGFRPDSH